MIEQPRKHHFVPQFWIRKFIHSDGKIWAFDKEKGQVRERSSKQLMQLFNLYTLQPSGIDDTTLETRDLNKVDTEGAAVFSRVLNGDRSKVSKEELASFFSFQIMRDHEIVTSYNPRAQELILSLLDLFDAENFQSFCLNWEARYPGASITKAEFEYINSLGLKETEDELEKIILALESAGGLPELPFTDVVRQPSGRNIIRDTLLSRSWTLLEDNAARFILGDTGVLFEKGDMSDLLAPISPKAVLSLSPVRNSTDCIESIQAADHQIGNINLEVAARARRWIVGEPSQLEYLKSQV